MFETSALALGSSADFGSFFVPAYGFSDAAQARSYAESDIYPFEMVDYSGGDMFSPLLADRRSYVPRIGASHNGLDVNDLMHSPRVVGEKPKWQTLRSRETPRAAGAYNVALLIEGRRQYFRHTSGSRKYPPFWHRMSNGVHDCYAAWSRHDGTPIGHFSPLSENVQMTTARSGRGVVYAEKVVFAANGRPEEMHVHVIGLEFSIFDKDPARSDGMRISQWHTMRHHGIGKNGLPDLRLLDPAWTTLVERARDRFAATCKQVPEEIETWRVWFLDQRQKEQTDSGAFAQHIAQMDWESALREVRQAWQLRAVITRHCGGEFNHTPSYHDSTASRVGVMLSRHDCNPERRVGLQQMVANYVAPLDTIWNYVGD